MSGKWRNIKTDPPLKDGKPDNDDICEYCESHCPASGYWRCPKCDAEWTDENDLPPLTEGKP